MLLIKHDLIGPLFYIFQRLHAVMSSYYRLPILIIKLRGFHKHDFRYFPSCNMRRNFSSRIGGKEKVARVREGKVT